MVKILNKVVLIGRLVEDPELRYTDEGSPFSTFTLAVNRNFTNSEGETDTDFLNIVSWNRLAENCSQFLKKGRLAAVEGRIQIRKNEEKEKTYFNPEIVANDVRFIEWPEQQIS